MGDQVLGLAAFRDRIKASRESFPHHWETSRKLMVPETLQTTLPALIQHIQVASLDPILRERLIDALQQFSQPVVNKEGNQVLRELTGYPPSKAVRALMVWGLLADVGRKENSEELSGAQWEEIIRNTSNPYDVLRHTATPSLLDVGAGDLSFEQELVDHYVPYFRMQRTSLTLHAFDRLMPGSRVGGVYHKNLDRERYLQSFSPEELRFKFWGGMGLETFSKGKGRLHRYTVSTCHAPANPTFAYEPSRLAPEIIHGHLQSSRGNYRRGRHEGEPVLEVSHRGRIITFPDWKFDILGPLRLLKFMTQRSCVSILSAIDGEVFWELLSQLLADDRFRPNNKIFTKTMLPEIFGTVYEQLSSMAVGERKELSRLADLRDSIPFQGAKKEETQVPGRFRYVEIRRGAVLDGVPSGFTARQFSQMKEESTPWWVILVTD
ncbi:MAG TPA: hypothetical protein PKK23_13295 [Nitrospirales bacterium]|nr:hypothetical protein [Nitrospiraceae bacterium]HNP30017.1 hypothetical protein [Nitrospirales bacterium]